MKEKSFNRLLISLRVCIVTFLLTVAGFLVLVFKTVL